MIRFLPIIGVGLGLFFFLFGPAKFAYRLWKRGARSREYRKLLQDPRWKKVAKEIKERDGWQCVICGERRKWLLQAHHCQDAYYDHRPYYTPGKKPWEYSGNHLETLCDFDHARWS